MVSVLNLRDAVEAFKASSPFGPGPVEVVYVGAWTSGPGDEQGHAVVAHNGAIFRPGVVTSYDGDKASFHWGSNTTDLWSAKVASMRVLDAWSTDETIPKE